jgi:hypothetical protein
MMEYDNAAGGKVKKINGDIYITGWLAPDFTIQRGEVFLTSDDKHFKSLSYSGKAEKYEGFERFLKTIPLK